MTGEGWSTSTGAARGGREQGAGMSADNPGWGEVPEGEARVGLQRAGSVGLVCSELPLRSARAAGGSGGKEESAPQGQSRAWGPPRSSCGTPQIL